jgi:GxxExxY protein
MANHSENELAKLVLDICFEIHRGLGPGLLESVYEEVLSFELNEMGIPFERQKGLPVYWKSKKMDLGYRPDLIVDNQLVVELKSVETVTKVHVKTTLTYIRLSEKKLGLLINFNVALLKEGIIRLVNNL